MFRTGIEHGMVLPDADVWEAADTVRAPLVYTRLAKHELIDVDVALKAVPRIVGLYGTPAAIELLERRAAPATRSKRPAVKRSARATPASRRR